VKTINLAALAFSFVASSARAEAVILSCTAEETAASHARHTWELTFDQQNQLVYIGKTVATAAITNARITFRVDLGAGVPFSFAIDRTSGTIVVTSDVRVLYNGQCKVVPPRPQ
jgi:hypothetical protein